MTSLSSSSSMIRRLLGKRQVVGNFQRYASSSGASQLAEDPSQLVSGLTREVAEGDPKVAEFLKANFSDASEEGPTDGYVIPPEVLKEFGYEESDFLPLEGKKYGDPRVDLGLGTPEQQALNIRTLRTYLRSEEGTRACNKLRYNKIIPGMLYGSDPSQGIDSKVMVKTPWPELQRELDRFHRKFESRVYDLTVYEDESDTEGTVHRVLPRDVQRHPVQGKVYCVNYLRYHPGRPIKIPIVYINQEESPALKRDGFIVPVNKHVECIVEDGVAIPPALELECTGITLKEVIRMDRLIFPDGVRASKRVDPEKFVIGPVFGGRGGASEDEDEEE